MDWNAFFKAVNTNLAPELKPDEKPKWYDVRHWHITEFGALVGMIGTSVLIYDKLKGK